MALALRASFAVRVRSCGQSRHAESGTPPDSASTDQALSAHDPRQAIHGLR